MWATVSATPSICKHAYPPRPSSTGKISIIGSHWSSGSRMLFVLVEDFAGAFSASGKCSVILVAGPRRRPSIQVIPFVRSRFDLVVSTTIASRKWRGLYIGPPLSHRKRRSVGWKRTELYRQFRLVQNERFRSRLQFTLSESIRPLGSDLLTASLSRAATRERGLRCQVLRELTRGRKIFAGR
jgi:hypothetical protein